MSQKLKKTEETVKLLAQIHHLYVFTDWALTRKFITAEEYEGIKKLLSSQSERDILVARSVLQAKTEQL